MADIIDVEKSIIYKKNMKILIKFLLALSSIAFIVFGLNMIDESCGCVRYQDTYMSLMLKAYVFCAVLLFLTSFLFTNNYPLLSMFIVVVLSLILLLLSSWIFYYYKGCISANTVQSTDRRFLGWNVASMVLSGAILLLSLVGIFYVFNKINKKSEYTSVQAQLITKIKEAKTKIDKEIETCIKEITKSLDGRSKSEDDKKRYFTQIEGELKKVKDSNMIFNLQSFAIYTENSNSSTIKTNLERWVNSFFPKIKKLELLIKESKKCIKADSSTCAEYKQTVENTIKEVTRPSPTLPTRGITINR